MGHKETAESPSSTDKKKITALRKLGRLGRVKNTKHVLEKKTYSSPFPPKQLISNSKINKN